MKVFIFDVSSLFLYLHDDESGGVHIEVWESGKREGPHELYLQLS